MFINNINTIVILRSVQLIKMDKLSVNILVRQEKIGNKNFFIVNNEELGVSDFGEDLNLALANFRKSLKMFLDAYPQKRKTLIAQEKQPLLLSKVFL